MNFHQTFTLKNQDFNKREKKLNLFSGPQETCSVQPGNRWRDFGGDLSFPSQSLFVPTRLVRGVGQTPLVSQKLLSS